ncbi:MULTISPECIES: helix-turn-helix domain-containing protein [unclassified Mucilaginibacter]|uniref:AraC family transcriptional regulator n=1 Tax=unclassified Mucilaginibacter TaxID=2617802 RepID=UPI002AC9AC53|nr:MULTISPECIES: helix-turn-helix domain-containing protein [unclassified Mucilaginibacter]MEB0263259.1 helix-turn-helix domain-containing protein [Mucilaginibacter sp. 10I4]MEB0280834.1 helix-turn-helix domain-containing protein [Mucilaginibacter sp. 10B2]MEB0302305.1 helix-turn-helix domain-containing protein [Mucilaginibacter sp. 5C4]WPX21712.1 helix-turn-helix domain-containing protein [Mucilaginibacter sp. 5C4]
MKPQLLKVSTDIVHSFSARRDIMPNVNNRWHYHPEVELVYFKKGNGTQFIGDCITQFNTGDVVLVGSNLPHYWQFNESYFDKEAGISADVSVIHFNENFWGDAFLQLPETQEIKNVLKQSKRGIQITGENLKQIGHLIEQIIYAEGARKIILLMEVLMAIGDSAEDNMLASMGFQHNFQEAEKDRINAIYNYSIANFKKKISLEEIAAVANISPNSFCKFFKSRSRKTYSRFINEIRVGNACKLLINNQQNVKEICYDSGFYNFASFHKYFKEITGKSPLTYQKTYIKQ